MAWTLLCARALRDEPGAPRDDAPSPDRNDPDAGEAWILAGGLARALFQAGAIDVLLRHRGPPAVAYASGMSAVNAMLLARADGNGITSGWESLRSRHFVARAAVGRLPLLGALANGHRELAETLSTSDPRTASASRSRVLVHSAGGFIEIGIPTDASSLTTTLAGLDPQRLSASDWLAEAILDAAADGAKRILVFAAANLEHAAVTAAAEHARVAGCSVSPVPFSAERRPRLADYLLPGLGGIDRLVGEGRSAAAAWLREAGTREADPLDQ